jgi:pimeloyl-ACP methyl ester carboxylesterase
MVVLWLSLMVAWAWAPADVERLVTGDGAEIALHHRAGAGEPVLLVHGISSNARFWDLADDHSLALALQEFGFDVWNLDLRGHGASFRDSRGKRQRANWSVDDYGLHDLPTAIAHILAETGAQAVHVVAHSMGGMALAVYLAHHSDPPLRSAVVVGSPLDFRDPEWATSVMLGASPVAGPFRFLPTPMAARGLATLGRDMPLQTDALLYDPSHFAPGMAVEMLRHVVSPMSRGEVRQMGAMRHDGEFRSEDGAIAYRMALGEVRLPMLFVAGRGDHIVSADRVVAYHDAVGSADKAMVVLSRANGFSVDYGHLDYCCSREASTEMFPLVAWWLGRHRGDTP